MQTFALRLFFAVAFLSAASSAQDLPKREFRGLWIATVLNIDWPPPPGSSPQAQRDLLISILDKAAAAGINAVVFQVRPECDAMYNSPYEPWSRWLTGAQGLAPSPLYDPLTFAVAEAHKRGMELHAWFNPYRAVRAVGLYGVSATHISVTHPEWILTIGTLKMLDPGLTAVRDYVAKIVADVTRRYDVDGVHMDDYFYGSGISTQDAATYAADPRGLNLGDWRRDNVNRLVKQIYDSVRVIKPWVKFGMSPAGIWKNGVPPGIIGQDNYSVIYCDAVAWLQAKSIDYIAPQLYWRFGGNQDYALLQPWWASVSNGRHFYPGLATYRIGEAAYGGATMVASQIRFNRTTGNAQGNIQYTANYITSSNAGGITDTLKNDVYRYPALLPVMSWKDSVAPYMPRGIRYEPVLAGGLAGIRWDLPNTAPDGDSASRYALYRFDHYPVAADLNNTRNLLAVLGERQAVPPVSPGSGPYYFAVTALDRNYNESDTSTILVVAPPPAPALASPPDNAAGLPDSVSLFWRQQGTASSYRVQISTDPAFTASLFLDAPSVADTTLKVRALLGQVKYYWRVRASSRVGGSGSFGSARSFSTGFPVAAPLVFPANGADKQLLTLGLRWNKPSGAGTYRIQVGKASDFAAPVIDTTGVSDTTITAGPLQPVTIYFWHVKTSNAAGSSAWSATFLFRTDIQTGVKGTMDLPTDFGLGQNYPNPFNPATVIAYDIPSVAVVRIVIYDVLGREVDTLVEETLSAGRYTAVWKAEGRASGVYFVRMTAGNFAAVRRMLLVK